MEKSGDETQVEAPTIEDLTETIGYLKHNIRALLWFICERDADTILVKQMNNFPPLRGDIYNTFMTLARSEYFDYLKKAAKPEGDDIDGDEKSQTGAD